MTIINPTKRNVLVTCLIVAPLLQFIGDGLWVAQAPEFSGNFWREASYIFFIPVGILLAKALEQKSIIWAILACAFYTIGCIGNAALMPIFRLGTFYPVQEHNGLPLIVESVLFQKGFGISLFIPSLCFPVGLIIFGIGFLRYKIINAWFGVALIIAGILFWLGNAVEITMLLLVGDAWLLAVFGFLAYYISKKSQGIGVGKVITA